MSSNDPSAGPPTDSDRELRGEFAHWLDAGAAPPAELDALFAGLQGQIARERGPIAWLRARSTPGRVALVAAALLLSALSVALLWQRPDLGVYPQHRMLLTFALGTLLLGAQLWLVLRPLHLPPVRAWLASAAGLGAFAGLFVIYALPPAHLAHPASIQAPGMQALLVRALPCLGAGLALSSAVYALLRAVDRGGVSRVLLASACSGVSANLLLLLHCPVTAPAHLLIGHLGMALAFVGGVALWTRTRPPRSRA